MHMHSYPNENVEPWEQIAGQPFRPYSLGYKLLPMNPYGHEEPSCDLRTKRKNWPNWDSNSGWHVQSLQCHRLHHKTIPSWRVRRTNKPNEKFGYLRPMCMGRECAHRRAGIWRAYRYSHHVRRGLISRASRIAMNVEPQNIVTKRYVAYAV